MSSAPPVMTSLQITAFRWLRDLRLKMAPVTVITGEQSSGRSSVLEAGSLVLRPLDAGQWSSMLRRRDTDISAPDGIWGFFPDSFDPRERDNQISSAITIAADFDPTRTRGRTRASLKAHATRGSGLTVHAEAEFHRAGAGGNRQLGNATISFPGTSDEDGQKPTAICPVFSLSSAGYGKLYAEGLHNILQRGFKATILRLLQSMDEQIQDVMPIMGFGGRQTVVFGYPQIIAHPNRPSTQATRWVDLSCAGDGLRRVLALGIALIRASHGMLFVDELESSLCPSGASSPMRSVIAMFLQIADQLQTQIVASTNSLELIDTMLIYLDEAPGRKDDLILHRLSISDRTGMLEARTYEQEQLSRLRDRALDIR